MTILENSIISGIKSNKSLEVSICSLISLKIILSMFCKEKSDGIDVVFSDHIQFYYQIFNKRR